VNKSQIYLTWAIIGSAAALILSPALAVITGHSEFYAGALLPVVGLLWIITPVNCRSLGFNFGNRQHYAIALFYPLSVMGVMVLLIGIFESIQVEDFQAGSFAAQFAFNFIAGIIIGLVTEEVFFRGALWALLKKKGFGPSHLILITAGIFSLWHLAVIFSAPEFGSEFPVISIFLYLSNILLIGMIWGLLRFVSRSILVTSVSHAFWNALAYGFFGFGTGYGILIKSSNQFFDPERGIVGVSLNTVFFIFFCRWAAKKGYFRISDKNKIMTVSEKTH